jgi:hypothetical protein
MVDSVYSRIHIVNAGAHSRKPFFSLLPRQDLLKTLHSAGSLACKRFMAFEAAKSFSLLKALTIPFDEFLGTRASI